MKSGNDTVLFGDDTRCISSGTDALGAAVEFLLPCELEFCLAGVELLLNLVRMSNKIITGKLINIVCHLRYWVYKLCTVYACNLYEGLLSKMINIIHSVIFSRNK